jgi:hypothetical protein
MSLFLWVFLVYAACICLLLFQCESMHLHNVFICLHFIYNASARVLCVYILNACSSKILCGIAQLDVGYVTVCFAERTIRVLWHSVARHGWMRTLQIVIRASVFNIEPGWAKQVDMK